MDQKDRDSKEFLAVLEADPGAPQRARRLLGSELGPNNSSDLGLMVSELVTNAVRYGRGRHLILRLATSRHKVRVEVYQQGEIPDLSPADSAGYGLRIVDALSDSWGPGEDWRGVWFEASTTDGAGR